MNDQVCVAPFSGGGGCSGGGGVVVNVGDGGDGGTGGTFSGAASSILPIVDFSTLTTAQKAQITAIVQTGYDFSTLTAAQKAALTAALGIGAGGTAPDGVGPAFDFSTLTAAQKAQIVAIAGSGGGALTPAQLNSALTSLYAPGAVGSVLQKQADGSIQAKPVLTTLPAGTAAGDGIFWDTVTNTWKIQQPTLSQTTLKAAIVAAPDSSIANPAVEVLAADSAGNPVMIKRQALAVTMGTSAALNPITQTPGPVLNTTVATVSAPTKGRYMVRYRAGYAIQPATGIEPKVANKRVDANLYVVSTTGATSLVGGLIAQETMTSFRAAIEPVAQDSPNKDAYGSVLLIGASGPFSLAAGETLNLGLGLSGTISNPVGILTQGLMATEYYKPEISLVKISDSELIDI